MDSLGASVLYVANAPARVCVVAGRRIDELGPVMSDRSTGAVELACPGEAGAIHCALRGGAAKITGEHLTFAFEVPDEEPRIPLGIHDMIPLGFPCIRCLAPACQQLMHRHRVHFRIRRTGRTCEVSPSVPGCLGDELCFSGSGPERGFCASHPEVCAGGDDDCDGRVDEGGDALCDDGVPCTLDRCSPDGCLPSPPELNQYACRPAFCVYAICDGEPPVHDRFGVPHDPSEPLRSPDANGCQVAFEDGRCNHSWGQCAYNGRSACDPARATATGNRVTSDSGCVEVEPAGALPCERAGDHDLCPPELCCEPDPDACAGPNPRD